MRRIVNYRAFLVTAVASAGAIVAAVYLGTAALIAVSVTAFVALVAAAVVFSVRKHAVVAAGLFLAAACFAASTVTTALTVHNYRCEVELGEAHDFVGKVVSVSASEPDYGEYIVGELTADGQKIRGSILLSVTGADSTLTVFLRQGDVIKFGAEVLFLQLVDESPDGYIYRQGIRYTASVSGDDVTFVSAEPSFLQTVQNKIRSLLTERLGVYGGIAYGMLTGEKGGISRGVRDIYSAAGIGHILAVSGLHVGFVMAILGAILRRLRVKKKATFIVTAAVLLLYCFLAGFSPSVVRASIMAVTALAATLLGERNDPLNTLCFSVTAILLARPLYLFDTGFGLSITAVLGLFFFQKPFARVLSRVLPGKIASALSVSFAAQLGITPVLAISFNTFSTYSPITNLIAVPIVGAGFAMLAITVLFALIIPPLAPVLVIDALPLMIVDLVARAIESVPGSSFTVFATALTLLVYVPMFMCSGYFMLPRRVKPIVSAAALVAMIPLIVMQNVPLSKTYSYATVSSYRDVTSVVRTDRGTVVVGDVKAGACVEKIMRSLHERKIDAVLVTHLDEENAAEIASLNGKFPIGAVYCPSDVDITGMGTVIEAEIEFYLFGEDDAPDLGPEPVYGDGFLGYTYNDNGSRIVMLGYGTEPYDLPAQVLDEAAVIRCYTYKGKVSERAYIVNYHNAYIDKAPLYETVASRVLAVDLYRGEIKSRFL